MRVIINALGHQYQWLRSGNRTFLEVASNLGTWWIVAFCAVEVHVCTVFSACYIVKCPRSNSASALN